MDKQASLNTLLLWASSVLLLGGAWFLFPQGNFQQVETLHRFWSAVAVMGSGFALSWCLKSVSGVWFWGIAIGTRLLLMPMEPGDDIWRYLWEGHIQNLGFSPYEYAPNAPQLVPFHTEWWGKINHPEVTAIYPPLAQIGFRLLARVLLHPLLFKGAFVAADLGVCALLYQKFGPRRSVLYAWNPLVIYAFAGGAHYDSCFLLPLVAAWLHTDGESPARWGQWAWSAVGVGISMGIKWISLPLLVFLLGSSLRQWRFRQTIGIGLCGIAPLGVSILPYCWQGSCPLIPTQSVFVTHGRSAEFIPHLVARVWMPSLTTNWLYAIPLTLFLGWLALRSKDLGQFAEGYWWGLLLLSPNVHSWYFTWMVPFAVASGNWGVRLVSLSAFIYFVLPSRLPDWRLTEGERYFLWLPLIVGWWFTIGWQSGVLRAKPRAINPNRAALRNPVDE